MKSPTIISIVAVGAAVIGVPQIAAGAVVALAIVLVVGFAFDWIVHRGGDH